jgi:hypothetical protein
MSPIFTTRKWMLAYIREHPGATTSELVGKAIIARRQAHLVPRTERGANHDVGEWGTAHDTLDRLGLEGLVRQGLGRQWFPVEPKQEKGQEL